MSRPSLGSGLHSKSFLNIDLPGPLTIAHVYFSLFADASVYQAHIGFYLCGVASGVVPHPKQTNLLFVSKSQVKNVNQYI